MTRKILIGIAIFFIIIIVGLFVAAYIIGRDTGQTPVETLIDFLPFGTFGDRTGFEESPFTETIGGEGFLEEVFEVDQSGRPIVPKLYQLTTTPISGATFLTDSEDVEKIRYIEQVSGNVYEITLEELKRRRLSNTTIPGIHEVLWGRDSLFIARYLNDEGVIKSFSAEIPSSQGGSLVKIAGEFLGDDIESIIISPDGSNIFYLSEFGANIIGTGAHFDGGSKRQLFSHPLKEWSLQWVENGTISLTTKPSSSALGYSFLLNKNTGSINRVYGDLAGLTTLYSPNGAKVLLSYIEGGALRTRVYTLKEGALSSFPLSTFASKCIWSKKFTDMIYCAAPDQLPDGEYPDDWYKGLVSFTDNLWKINLDSGSVSLLVSPREFAREEIDVVDLFLDDEEKYLFFTNKKDSTLWRLKLSD